MERRGIGDRFWCEQLPVSPRAAIGLAEKALVTSKRPPTLVGSSLGGFYANWVQRETPDGEWSELRSFTDTSDDEKRAWIGALTGVTCGSDAFFPFRDSIDRAAATGVTYVLEPGGSTRDDIVIQAANEYGMTMLFSGVRLFHH